MVHRTLSQSQITTLKFGLVRILKANDYSWSSTTYQVQRYSESASDMPVPTSPYDVPAWTRPAETTESLDWAPLQEIDLSIFDQPGGKEKLAADLHYAVKNGALLLAV